MRDPVVPLSRTDSCLLLLLLTRSKATFLGEAAAAAAAQIAEEDMVFYLTLRCDNSSSGRRQLPAYRQRSMLFKSTSADTYCCSTAPLHKHEAKMKAWETLPLAACSACGIVTNCNVYSLRAVGNVPVVFVEVQIGQAALHCVGGCRHTRHRKAHLPLVATVCSRLADKLFVSSTDMPL